MTNDSNMQTIDAADRWHTDRRTVVVGAAKLDEALAQTAAGIVGEGGAVPIRVIVNSTSQNVIIGPRSHCSIGYASGWPLPARRRRFAIKYGASPDHAACTCCGSSQRRRLDA
jgi:hypothetical protein